MKNIRLRHLIFWALCCCMGLFCKRLIAPAANIITDALHVPGGIGTGFSLMFLSIAATLLPHATGCTIMSAVQSGLALSLGMVGSMGALSPIGYILPGLAMDLVFCIARKLNLPAADRIVCANAIGSVCAALAANWIVFRLHGIVLLLYLSISGTSGAAFGILGAHLAQKLQPIINIQSIERRNAYEKV